MRHQQPGIVAADENVGRLRGGVVKSFGKRSGDVLGAGHPADVAFHANPHAAQRYPNPLGTGENSRPALAHFVPAEQQLPAWVDALDPIIVRPHVFHFRQVQRFKRGVKRRIRGAQLIVGR